MQTKKRSKLAEMAQRRLAFQQEIKIKKKGKKKLAFEARNRVAIKEAAQQLTSLLQNRILTYVQMEASIPALEAVTKIRDYSEKQLSDWNHNRQNTMAQVQPEGTRFVKVGLHSTAFVIEQKPTLRTLRFDDRLLYRLSIESYRDERTNGGDYVKLQVSLPYVVFIVTMINKPDGYLYHTMKTHFRKEPLRSLQDDLYHTILPNMNEWVCLGDSSKLALAGTPAAVVDNILAHYWSAGFTLDYTSQWVALASSDGRFRTAQTWTDASKADPDFAVKVAWNRCYSLHQALEHSLSARVSDSPLVDGDGDFIGKTVKEFEQEISKLIARASSLDSLAAKSVLAAVENTLSKLAD